MKRSRYNANARQSSHKKRKIQRDDGDSNAQVVERKPVSEKEQERKARLLQQMMAEKESSKWSKQKKQRLEKYIDKKLLQEERESLLNKLEHTQKEVSNTAKLESSAFLGTGKSLTHEEIWEKEREKAQEILKISVVPQAKDIGGGLRDKNSVFSGWKNSSQLPDQDESEFDSSDSALDSSEDSDSDSDSSVDPNPQPAKQRSLGFKAWATSQLDKAKGYQDSVSETPSEPVVTAIPSIPPKFEIEKPKDGLLHGPLGKTLPSLPASSFSSLALSSSNTSKPSIVRKPDIQEARLQLPILSQEHEIVEAISLNPVTIIQGETGCGKTTQVVQFLYEAGFGLEGNDNSGLIGITQPRRVAAVSTAQRVSDELSPPSQSKDQPSNLIGYQIRYQSTISSQTRIKFMTDGVLLREMQGDFLLTKYSIIVVDEAHERSINTDLLIGLLSRIIRLRESRWKEGKSTPLRLIIMSASSLTESFFGPPRLETHSISTPLFDTPPPSLNIAARTHPVSIHFSKRTRPDYIKEALKKVIKIHTRLPSGGILVFLTGMEEIKGFIRVLEGKFKNKRSTSISRTTEEDNIQVNAAKVPVEVEDIELDASKHDPLDNVEVDENEDLMDDPEGLETSDEEDAEDDEELNRELGLPSSFFSMTGDGTAPMHILPLHSLLPSSEQLRVFQPPPEGHRLVVVSTNIAETSLTIPGIRYVVDCGRAKERHYNHQNQTTSYPIAFISKSSALQRAGRAGRTGPGHCYRLYSSALYEHYFPSDKNPEILNMSLESLVLTMKSMGIDKVLHFPFVTPPGYEELKKAEEVLNYLGALDSSGTSAGKKITTIGKTMALFPLSPRQSRMLVSARQHGVLPYVITLVSAMSVGDPFLREAMESDEGVPETMKRKRKEMFTLLDTHASLGNYTSDAFRLLSVVGAYEYARGGADFCEQNFLRSKIMAEIHQFRIQLMNIVRTNFEIPANDVGFTMKLNPPSDHQVKILRQLLCTSSLDKVAFRKDRASRPSGGTKYATSRGVPYLCPGMSEDVFIHHSSILVDRPPPEYIVFEEMQLLSNGKRTLKGITVVHPAWIASLGKGRSCTFSKPVKNAQGVLTVIPRFGPAGWELPAMPASSIL